MGKDNKCTDIIRSKDVCCMYEKATFIKVHQLRYDSLSQKYQGTSVQVRIAFNGIVFLLVKAVLLLWIFYVFVLSCVCYVLCASVYMCFVVTCWERADLLALVCGVFCEFVTFPLVSWVRCGTWLYRFLIFATLLTLVFLLLTEYHLEHILKEPTIRNSYQFPNVPSHEWQNWKVDNGSSILMDWW